MTQPEHDNDPAIPVLALRPRDCAKSIGVCERTLWTLTNQGKGPPSLRIGKTIVYPVAELAAWLSQQAKGGRER